MSRHLVRTVVPISQTRWVVEFEQVLRNNLLRPAVNQSVEHTHKGSLETIVEQNISDQVSKVGRPVPADGFGLNPRDWETNAELESFRSSPFEIKDTIEHKKECIGAQNLMFLYDLKTEGVWEAGGFHSCNT